MLKFCKGCEWATDCGGITYCPWPAGMCIRIKGSFDEPDEFKLRKKILRTEFGVDEVKKEDKEVCSDGSC